MKERTCQRCGEETAAAAVLYVGRPVDDDGSYDLRPVEVAYCRPCLRRLNRFWLLFSPVMALLFSLGAALTVGMLEVEGAWTALAVMSAGALGFGTVLIVQLLRRRRLEREPTAFYKAAWLRRHAGEDLAAFTPEELAARTGAKKPPEG